MRPVGDQEVGAAEAALARSDRMAVSAEFRWFWRGQPPEGLEDWFLEAKAHPCAAGGGKTRKDHYLKAVGEADLGIKYRGDPTLAPEDRSVEVKGLIAVSDSALASAPFVGPIQIWCKWPSGALHLPVASLIVLQKQRWLRKFNTDRASPEEIRLNTDEKPFDGSEPPKRGCNVELTKVDFVAAGETWWTMGFEAFGSLQTIEGDLRSVAATFARRLSGDRLQSIRGELMSYPAWLVERTKSLG